MNQIVVDTDVASYIFNWHSLSKQYANALRGSELILSFMSVAELRMGEMSAGWGSNRRLPLERFVQGFELSYPDNDLCTDGPEYVLTHEQVAGRSVPRTPGSLQLHWPWTRPSQRTIAGISRTFGIFGCYRCNDRRLRRST